MNCKTIPGDAVVFQHILGMMDLRTRRRRVDFDKRTTTGSHGGDLKIKRIMPRMSPMTGRITNSMTGQSLVIQLKRFAIITVGEGVTIARKSI